jgi:hypothetical protein
MPPLQGHIMGAAKPTKHTHRLLLLNITTREKKQ